LINVVETSTVKSLEPLIVSPNPTSDFISLSGNFQTISILGSNGELAKSIKNYNASEIIDVSYFTPGQHFIKGQSSNKVVQIGSFVVGTK
jgi:hypothetical protein